MTLTRATFGNLVEQIREGITASSSPTSNNYSDDEVLNIRFRRIILNLLHTYFLPSSAGKEKEVGAAVRLISYTAKNNPGVFYHGKATGVLPVIAPLLPFLADPLFRSRHGIFFETIGSLLSSLRSAERDFYRHFFVDCMFLIQGINQIKSNQINYLVLRILGFIPNLFSTFFHIL